MTLMFLRDPTAHALARECEREPVDHTAYLVLADRIQETGCDPAAEHAVRWLAARRKHPARVSPRRHRGRAVSRVGWGWCQRVPPFATPDESFAWGLGRLPVLLFRECCRSDYQRLKPTVLFTTWWQAVEFLVRGLEALRAMWAIDGETAT